MISLSDFHGGGAAEPPCGRGPDAGEPSRIAERLAAHRRREIPPGGLARASVAVPLFAGEEGNPQILFTVRTDRVEHHKGEISFPGGKCSPEDADGLSTALRETFEEVGVPPESFRCLGVLDDFISISGFLVTPYVVWADRPVTLRPHPPEVAEVLLIPVAHLLDPAHHHCDGFRPDAACHSFHWNGKRIWGLTGGILHQFLSLVYDFHPG